VNPFSYLAKSSSLLLIATAAMLAGVRRWRRTEPAT
jgi:hypothetical protein